MHARGGASHGVATIEQKAAREMDPEGARVARYIVAVQGSNDSQHWAEGTNTWASGVGAAIEAVVEAQPEMPW